MVAEMEGLHGMKRKQLQALCKKHGVPANLTNRQMADKLSLLLKVSPYQFLFYPCSSFGFQLLFGY
jgi:hypothetical protein